MNSFGVAVMRACPVHLGHQAIIERMLGQYGANNCLVLLGSSNHPLSFRYMFSFAERYQLIMSRYAELTIAGLPDFPGDDEAWLHNLNTTLNLVKRSLGTVTFFGGCHEDVEWFKARGFAVQILNRFTGEESPPISATQVRDALLEGRSLEGLIDPILQPKVKELFVNAMSRLKKL